MVFDLDGTLLNTLPDIAQCMNRALEKNGLPMHPEEAYRLFTGNGAAVLAERAVKEHQELKDSVLKDYLKDYSVNCQLNTCPYDGIPELLEVLQQKGFQLIVFSNKDDLEAKRVVAHYFPGIRFSAVLGSVKGVPLKPAPDALLKTLEDLKLRTADGLYAGDTVMDVCCAKAAGLKVAAVAWGFQTEEVLSAQKPDYLIYHPQDLVALVEN